MGESADKVCAVTALCPQHRFQMLTKRPERMAEYFRRDGYAFRTDGGDGDARRTDDGEGHATRDGDGEGHAVRTGDGPGDAVRDGSGDGKETP